MRAQIYRKDYEFQELAKNTLVFYQWKGIIDQNFVEYHFLIQILTISEINIWCLEGSFL